MAKDKAKKKTDKPKVKSKRAPLKLTKTLVWRLSLVFFILLCGAVGSVLWTSGARETKDAFADGRRLLIRIDNGIIQGKQATVEEAKPAAAATPTTPAPTPEAAAASGETADLDPSMVIKPSGKATPLAGVNQSLIEKTAKGELLPAVGADGTTPWRYYGKPYERKGTLPMIAIAIGGLGENRLVTENAIALPESITLSFSPYAHDLATWAKSARANGHEVLIDLPLEPANYPVSDPGPEGLLAGKGSEQNDAHLQWLMSRFQGYAGFLTPQDEGFSDNTDAFKAMMQILSNRGLLLVVGREPAKSDTRQLLDATNATDVVADVLLDEDLSPTAIQTRLTTLERTAKSRGYAVGIGRAYPVTLQQINQWAARLAEDGFVLVPVTYIARLRFS